MGIMDGKRVLVFGIANERSYAWYIAKQLKEQGAELAFTYLPIGKMEHRVIKACAKIGIENPWLVPCDASDDASLEEVFAKAKRISVRLMPWCIPSLLPTRTISNLACLLKRRARRTSRPVMSALSRCWPWPSSA